MVVDGAEFLFGQVPVTIVGESLADPPAACIITPVGLILVVHELSYTSAYHGCSLIIGTVRLNVPSQRLISPYKTKTQQLSIL